MSNVFAIEALNLYDSINIKAIRNLLSGKIVDSSPQSLDLQYGENSYLFVYRFGCLVLFNISAELKEQEIGKLRTALGPGLGQITTENYQVISSETPMKVEFEYAELKRFSLDQLRMICMTVGQSAGVEYFEMQTDRMLRETSNFMEDLSRGGAVPLLRPQRLLRIIGSTASTRQHILSNLSVLDPPELTWKSKELAKLFAEVQENFDIQTRFRTLDRKLTLIQDNIEILADLSSTRRNTLLESLVVILILIELVILLVSAHI